MAGQLDQWFKLADEDKDGVISGAEAVRFFTKSGLSQPTLGTIWEISSGGKPNLNQQQFAIALKLVSLAQASRGALHPEQARAVAMGGGPPLPLPTLVGINAPTMPVYTPQVTGAPGGYTPQVTGAPGYRPQMTGYPPAAGQPTGAPGMPYAPQMSGMPPGGGPPRPGMPGQPGVGMYSMQQTGAAPSPVPGAAPGMYRPAMTGVSAPMPGMQPPASAAMPMPAAAGVTGMPAAVTGVAPPGGFPPATPADVARYQAMFAQLDTDRDGFVKGGECMQPFMAWGLDKAVLKRIWDMVAGTAAQLNPQQFMACIYLMDNCKRGMPLPAALPPGPFPPLASGPAAAGPTGVGMVPAGGPGLPSAAAAGATGITGMLPDSFAAPPESPVARHDTWSLSSQFGEKTATKAINDSYDQTLPRLPDMPGKFVYDAKMRPPPPPGPEVPGLSDEIASMLAPTDKTKYDEATATASQRAAAVAQQEAEAAAAKHRLEQYQHALGELMLFKSRMDVILLQAHDQTMRLEREAEETERRYSAAHIAAQTQFEASSSARQALQALLARKQESLMKLDLLQQELAVLANFSPEQMAALEAEVGGVVAQVAAAEAQKAAYDMQLDSGKRQKALLADKMADLKLAAAAGEAELGKLRGDLAALVRDVADARANEVALELSDVTELLKKAAGAYRSLYSSAVAAGFDIPYEANLNNVGGLVWVEHMMAGTADWLDADEDAESAGYVLVNALPDLEGVPPSVRRAASRAMATTAPALIKPVGKALRFSSAGDAAPGANQVAEGEAAAAEGAGGAAEKTEGDKDEAAGGAPAGGSEGGAAAEAGGGEAGAGAKKRDSGPGEGTPAAAAGGSGGGAATSPKAAGTPTAAAAATAASPKAAAGAKKPEAAATVAGASEPAAVTAAAAGATPKAAAAAGGGTPKAAAVAGVAAVGAAAAATGAAMAAGMAGKAKGAESAATAAAPLAEVPAAPAAAGRVSDGFEDSAFDTPSPFADTSAALPAAAAGGADLQLPVVPSVDTSSSGAAITTTTVPARSLDSSLGGDLAPHTQEVHSEIPSDVPDEAASMWVHAPARLSMSGRPSDAQDGGVLSDDSSVVGGYRAHGPLVTGASIASSGYEEEHGLSALQQQLVGDLQRVYGAGGAGTEAAAATGGAQHAAPAPKESTGGFEDNAF